MQLQNRQWSEVDTIINSNINMNPICYENEKSLAFLENAVFCASDKCKT